MKKRFLAMLLCVCMAASFLPGLVYAAGETEQKQVWVNRGMYRANSDTFIPWGEKLDRYFVDYTASQALSFYYGTENEPGDAVRLKNWSYTAPEGITGSTVTLEEKTDANGVVFYQMEAEYPGDEDCTGILNLELNDGTEATFKVYFSKPSSGWYTAAENTYENYLSDRIYYGRAGEEKKLYYFHGRNENYAWTKLEILDGNNNVLQEASLTGVTTYNGYTIDASHYSDGYITVTGTVASGSNWLRLKGTRADGGSDTPQCSFQLDPTLPVAWLRSGSYNSSQDKFTMKNSSMYQNGYSVAYTASQYVQFYYGVKDAYGDPVTLKSWSYTAPEGITGSSVTLEKKTDANGVVFYQLAAEYLSDESCTGTLNLVFSDETKETMEIRFNKPSEGWYTAAENTYAYYLSDATYYGYSGESKKLHYFHGQGKDEIWTKLEIVDNNNNVIQEASMTGATTYNGYTIDPSNYSDGYITVTGTVTSGSNGLRVKASRSNGGSDTLRCFFKVDPSLPVAWIREGNYNNNGFTERNYYRNDLSVHYYGTKYAQFHYSTKDNYGDPVTLKSWSYTAPNGITGSSVTVTEKTDANGKVFYQIDAKYLGDESCTGTLNLVFSNESQGTIGVDFSEPSAGWYTAAEASGKYYLDSPVYAGTIGEEQRLYYFFQEGNLPTKILASRRLGVTQEETEIPLDAVTLYRQWEIDTTHLKDGYFSASGIVTEDHTIMNELILNVTWKNERTNRFTCRWSSRVMDATNGSEGEPTITENGVTYTFAPATVNGHFLQFASWGGARMPSWKDTDQEFFTWEYVVAATEKVGGSEKISSSFDRYITDVTCEIVRDADGTLLYQNITSEDPNALKVEAFKSTDPTDPHPWKLNISVRGRHLISALLKVTIKVKMPGWDEAKTYTYPISYIATKTFNQGQDFEFDASAYDTAEKLNAILSDAEAFQAAFRLANYDDYCKWLDEREGTGAESRIILKLPAVEYEDVIYVDVYEQLRVRITLQGSEQAGQRTTMPGLNLKKEHGARIESINFKSKPGVAITHGTEELSCGVLGAYEYSISMTDCTISGFDIGVLASRAQFLNCTVRGNGIGWLSQPVANGSTGGIFDAAVSNSEFVGNDVGIKVTELPEGTTAIKMLVENNNFVDNDLDMDMANGELGAMFYCYKNYFGWTVNGSLVPRTALVELGKDTTVITNPRRWAPVGSGDNRLFIDILYPGVTWIINSQTSDLKISEDLIDTENDTEMTVTDEEGNKVGKWKFEGGKKKK